MKIDRVYLDNCCNSRLFDNNTSPNDKQEADAIRRIIKNQIRGGYIIVGSFAVKTEIGQIPDDETRLKAMNLYKMATFHTIKRTAQIIARAQKLEAKGLSKMDATHLAAAEAAKAKVLLTTDVRFIKKCANNDLSKVNVMNPLSFRGGYYGYHTRTGNQ